MMHLCSEVLTALQGKTLATAESITGGGIGGALTGVSGASAVYRGGIISYCDEIKHKLLGVPAEDLQVYGAVSAPVAKAMAQGARQALNADIAVSVTGLAGPGGDGHGHEVGTVFIGYSDARGTLAKECHFEGSREEVRLATIREALTLVLAQNRE